MENEIKENIIDSEETNEEEEESEEETEEETPKEPEKPKETPKAKKARLTRQLKKVNKELGVDEEVADKPDADKSDELNEGQIALLAVKGYDNTEDIEFIQQEMKDSRKSLTEVLNLNYIKESLKDMKKARDVVDATPEGTKRAKAGARDDVDYWIAKGEMPERSPENAELRRKIINQRIKVDGNKNKFSDNPLIQ